MELPKLFDVPAVLFVEHPREEHQRLCGPYQGITHIKSCLVWARGSAASVADAPLSTKDEGQLCERIWQRRDLPFLLALAEGLRPDRVAHRWSRLRDHIRFAVPLGVSDRSAKQYVRAYLDVSAYGTW